MFAFNLSTFQGELVNENSITIFQQGISHDTLLYSAGSETMEGFLSSMDLPTSLLPTK